MLTSIRRNLSLKFTRRRIHFKMEQLKFDNSVLKNLPLDSEKDNFIRQVKGACFSRVKPTPVKNPVTVAYSQSAISNLLDIPSSETENQEFAEYFSGNKLFAGSQPAAHCYCGHQFGYFSGQLGDGAAIYLGEVINKKGERWEIQLKGAGSTPFSRSADGRKVLRSSIREFLCSEALHHLGIPTTRAGSCVTSDTKVIRDILYDGHPIEERATVVLRIAQTFLRFGSFEIFLPISPETGRKGPSEGQTDILHTMLRFTIKNYYPEIFEAHHKNEEKMYVEFYKEVVVRTARLVADWQCVGWCHGVLNTDNMSVYGLTIDYGPYGFMDKFDFDFICNGSDNDGRYTYKKQPEICKWNCMKFAEALHGAISKDKLIPELEKLFDVEFEKHYLNKMKQKFGVLEATPDEIKNLAESFFETMHETGADMTNAFRSLSYLPYPESKDFEERLSVLKEYILSQCSTIEELKQSLAPKMDPRQLQMLVMMMQMNPGILEAMGGGHRALLSELNRIEKSKTIKDMSPEQKRKDDDAKWTSWLIKYKDCLSKENITDVVGANAQRVSIMNKTNPRFVLRNWIAQSAIKEAEKGNFTEVQNVLKLLENPYEGGSNIEVASKSDVASSTTSCGKEAHQPLLYDIKPPSWAIDLVVT